MSSPVALQHYIIYSLVFQSAAWPFQCFIHLPRVQVEQVLSSFRYRLKLLLPLLRFWPSELAAQCPLLSLDSFGSYFYIRFYFGCWHDFHLAGQGLFLEGVTVSSTCLTSVVQAKEGENKRHKETGTRAVGTLVFTCIFFFEIAPELKLPPIDQQDN